MIDLEFGWAVAECPAKLLNDIRQGLYQIDVARINELGACLDARLLHRTGEWRAGVHHIGSVVENDHFAVRSVDEYGSAAALGVYRPTGGNAYAGSAVR